MPPRRRNRPKRPSPGRPRPAAPGRPHLPGEHALSARGDALGLLPNPVTNKVEVQLDQAKHSIDLLTMLQQKTEGNRTPQESDELEAALHELRLTYVSVNEPGKTHKSGLGPEKGRLFPWHSCQKMLPIESRIDCGT